MKQVIINKLKDFFKLQPIEKAWVFGSYSRGEETHESDIDMLVRFDSNANITTDLQPLKRKIEIYLNEL